MAKHELPGETVAGAYPAHVEIITFCGVEVMRIRGSRDEVRETTRMYDMAYPSGERRTFGDACYWGLDTMAKGNVVEIFELITLRKL